MLTSNEKNQLTSVVKIVKELPADSLNKLYWVLQGMTLNNKYATEEEKTAATI